MVKTHLCKVRGTSMYCGTKKTKTKNDSTHASLIRCTPSCQKHKLQYYISKLTSSQKHHRPDARLSTFVVKTYTVHCASRLTSSGGCAATSEDGALARKTKPARDPRQGLLMNTIGIRTVLGKRVPRLLPSGAGHGRWRRWRRLQRRLRRALRQRKKGQRG